MSVLEEKSRERERKELIVIITDLNLEDVLDVSSLQGVPGIVGTLLVSIFADPRIGGSPPGLLFGGGLSLLVHQMIGVLCCSAWSVVVIVVVVVLSA